MWRHHITLEPLIHVVEWRNKMVAVARLGCNLLPTLATDVYMNVLSTATVGDSLLLLLFF